jgi:Glycosyl transferase family 2
MVTKTRPVALAARPRVSVVIPCYNYGHFLPECVATVLDQDGVDVDVLIVDDASTDDSAAMARKLATDARVRVLEHPVNRGHIATYNEGLAAVEGEFVVLLSADDLLTPGSLARSAALLRAHPEVGLVYGFSPGFTGTPPPARLRVRSWSIWPGVEWIGMLCRRVANPVATPEVMMRASLMHELVGYDSRVPHAADLLLWLRAAARAPIGRINGADQAFYRRHGANMHVERYAGVRTDILERLKTFEILFAEDAPWLPDGQALHELARRSLAREALVTVCRSYELGRDGGAAQDLLALAEEIVPRSDSDELWRAFSHRLARAVAQGPLLVPRPVGLAVDDLAYRLRWRRWRRTGLLGSVNSV